MPDSKTPDSDENRAAARKLVRTVVLAQGNIFIRELLRRKKIPIGITKQDFEGNLLRAINASDLQLSDLIEWLEEVEGWGDQHVYLYHVPAAITTDPLWNSADAVKKRLPTTARKFWNAASLVFPEKWSLTGISYGDRSLRTRRTGNLRPCTTEQFQIS